MRNVSRALIGAAVAGALTVGVLGGVAVARQSAEPAGVPYELLAVDSAADETVALTQSPRDNPRLRFPVRRGLVGIHGEATVRARDGKFATYTWQRGQVTALSAGSLTVKSADGVSWAWTMNSDTRVRKNGARSTPSALATGDNVFVLGQPDGDGRTAQGVVVPRRFKE
jgi:hypothetical protein